MAVVCEYLGNEVVAEGMKKAKIIMGPGWPITCVYTHLHVMHDNSTTHYIYYISLHVYVITSYYTKYESHYKLLHDICNGMLLITNMA